MSPCFRDARKTWEIFGRGRKRRITWRSWTEVKVNNGRGQRGAAGRGRSTRKFFKAREVQLKSIWSTNTLILQREILRLLRRLKSRVIIKGDPVAWVCGAHLQDQVVVVLRNQIRCLLNEKEK
jgi:hypothetical protein